VNGLLAKIGIAGLEWQNYFTVLLAHAAVAFTGYFLFGGLRLLRRTSNGSSGDIPTIYIEFQPQHWVTIGVIAVRCSGEGDPVKHVPWGPILMVSGVTILVNLLQKTGGMDLFSALLVRLSTQESVTAIVAFVTGVISVYSSTSGVVLPAFIPTVPGLVERLGVDPLSIAWSMFVGAHLVDISPLSTTGALCIASAPAAEDHRLLFNKLLAWGLSMSVVGAAVSYLCFGVLWQ
jgi:di/tricarboxylate transporter